MASKHFTKKSLAVLFAEADETGEHTLKRTLGPTQLVMLGIGAIIGAGLFSITGGAAAHNAGPAVTISFAEFASMIPVAGSAYTYSYATMGRFIAWIIGWDLVLEYAVGAVTVSISWSRYLVKFLEHYNIQLAPQMTMSPWDSVTMADGSIVTGIMNLPAVFIVVLMSLILVRGTQESSRINGVIVGLKVAVVLVFIHWF